MIIYAAKKTFERYKLKLPAELTPPLNVIAQMVIENESGDKLLVWGAKLFYFDKRKCIQVVYKDDKEMTKALKKLFEGNPVTCFAKLTDKGAIAALNTTQSRFADDGYRFYEIVVEFMEDD